MSAAEHDQLGPVEYLVLHLPDGAAPKDGFAELAALAAGGHIFVLDLELYRRGDDGALTKVDAASLDWSTDGLEEILGLDAGLLDDEDLELATADVPAGDVVAVLVYEDRTLLAAVSAWEDHGAHVVRSGPVDVDELTAALDATA